MFDFADEDYTGESKYSEILPGLNIPAVLTGVEVDDESGDLIFAFKGTEKGDLSKGIKPNNGTFNHRVWANNFDKDNEYYDEQGAKRKINAIKHILKAYLPVEQIEAIKSDTWLGFASGILDIMKDEVYKDKPVSLKIVLNNKNKPVFPTFPDFISSQLMPKTFRLDQRVNPNTQMPYERITPIEVPTTAEAFDSIGQESTSFGEDAQATTEEPTPKFGA